MRAAGLLVAVTLAAAVPGAAQAAAPGNPFAPLPAQPVPIPSTPAAAPTPTTVNSSSPGGGLSSGAAVAIGIGALVVLGGIAFFIWYDARRRAPVRSKLAAEAAAGAGRVPGSKRPPKSRKLSPAERRRRKRGKAR